MKKTPYSLFLAAAAALAVLSCTKVSVEAGQGGKEDERNAIEFKSSIPSTSGFQTSLTEAGLFVSEPVSVNNVKLTIGQDGSVTPQTQIFWAAGQVQNSSFLAYSPYNPEYTTRSTVDFSARSDQSSADGLAASDLMVAATSSKPTDGAVSLEFRHVMSHVLIFFDNKTEKEISGVTFKGLKTGLSLNLVNGATTTGSSTGDVKAYKDSGMGCFRAIVPAQTCNLTVEIAFTDGSSMDCTAKGIALESGKYYDNSKSPLVIEDIKPQSIKLNFAVSDWADGGQLDFNKTAGPDGELMEKSVPGIYSISGGKVESVLTPAPGVQVCGGRRSSSITFSIIDAGKPASVFCRISASSLAEGSDVSATISSIGDTGIQDGNVVFNVLKSENGTYWLKSGDGKTAIVLNL